MALSLRSLPVTRKGVLDALVMAAFSAACVALFCILVKNGIKQPVQIAVCLAVVGSLFAGRRSLRPSLAVILAAGPLFILSGEVYFRFHYFGLDALRHPTRYVPASPGDPIANVPLDPGSFTGLRAGAKGMLKGVPFQVNDLGFRGRVVAPRPSPRSVRIAVFGSSSDMGDGVGEGLNYSSRLEDMLNDHRAGSQVEVLNFAFGGYSINDIMYVLEHKVLVYEPDIVLISAYCLSHTDLGRVRLLDRLQEYDFRTTTRIVTTLKAPWKALFFVQAIRNEMFVDFASQIRTYRLCLARAFEKVVRPTPPGLLGANRSATADSGLSNILDQVTAQTKGRRVYVVSLSRTGYEELGTETKKRLSALCRARGIGFIDTAGEDYGGNGFHHLTIYVGDRHPNAKAHEIYAKAMHRVLEPVVADIERLRRTQANGSAKETDPMDQVSVK